MITLAVIGYGYWGPNLVRNFNRHPDCRIKRVIDFNPKRLKLVNELYPAIQTGNSVDEIWQDSEIDAVVIATPVTTHYPFALQAIESGKHVLVEKPLTSSRIHCEDLIDRAEKKGRALMVDHTFLYTGAVRRIKKLIDDGEIGDIQYFDSTRINLGLFQEDVNVVWDLACHDISILNYLVKEKPVSVVATGVSHLGNNIENLAYITLHYASNRIAHFNCSWASPLKVRKILIGGTKKMIVFDDIEPTEKIKIYDTGFSINPDEKERLLVDYRTGDIYIPKIEQTEALSLMSRDFIDAILKKKEPVSNWKTGLQVVSILEAAQQSIKKNGMEVQLS